MNRRTFAVAVAAALATLALVVLTGGHWNDPEPKAAATTRPTQTAGQANQGPPSYTVADLGIKLAYARVTANGTGTLVIETTAGAVDITRAKGVFTGIAWSPDGRKLAMSYGPSEGSQDIWMFDTETGQLIQLTQDGRSRRPTWSPDGSAIAFSQGGEGHGQGPLFTVAATGSAAKPLSKDARDDDAAWAPDASSIAVVREAGKIALISPTTGEVLKEVNLLREASPTFASLDWSPESDALATAVRVGQAMAAVVVGDKLTSQKQVGGAFLGNPADPAWVHPSWVPGFPKLIAASETSGALVLIDLAATATDMPSGAPYSPVQVLVAPPQGTKLAFPAVYGPRAAGGSSIV